MSNRYLKYAEVRKVLIKRTVRYLALIGRTVSEALDLGWLISKFKAEALSFEAEISPAGVAGTVKHSNGRGTSPQQRSNKRLPSEMKPAILDTPIQLELRFE